LREGFIIQQQRNLLGKDIDDINNSPISLLVNLDQYKHAEGYIYLDNYKTEMFYDNRTRHEYYKIVINSGSIFAFNQSELP
jgi:hypothetical protein